MNTVKSGKQEIKQIGVVSRALCTASLICLLCAVIAGRYVTAPKRQQELFSLFETALGLGTLLFLLAIPAFIAARRDYFHSGRGPDVSATPLRIAFYTWCVCLGLLFYGCERDQYLDGPSKRSKIARVKGDQRTLAIALDTYYLDHNAYPAWSLKKEENAFGSLAESWPVLTAIPTFRMQNGSPLATLTTPISYVSSLFTDPFAEAKGASFAYWSYADHITTATVYIVWSPGPDGRYDITIENVAKVFDPHLPAPSPALLNLTYDPSNGTASRGDVYRYKF